MSAPLNLPRLLCILFLLLATGLSGCGGGSEDTKASSSTPDPATPDPSTPAIPSLTLSENASGVLATYAASGFINRDNPFFQQFGNGRRCSTCHMQDNAWSLTPASAQAKFDLSAGKDALFLANDAATSPLADVSTPEARKTAFSLLLNKGLIRMQAAISENAEFTLSQVDDPYAYANSVQLSLFRRPLPATNLKFQSTFMWDASATVRNASSSDCIIGSSDCYADTVTHLTQQAGDAMRRHAQVVADLSPAQLRSIVDFELGLFTAQQQDNNAKTLTDAGAAGGPFALSKQDFYFGINDPIAGDYRSKQAFNANAMTLFDGWDPAKASISDASRQSIARGQKIFNSRAFDITGVRGLNDDLNIASMRGSCTTCHNAPNIGSHAVPRLFNTGLSDASRRTPDLPLYTLKNKQTGEILQTTDPGAALQSGKWRDIGRFKVPALRGLAARPPYFHNGSAKTIEDVIDFYNGRFNIGLTVEDKRDLAAFLHAL